MRKRDHQLPASGPESDPVIFGVARGLEELFPPIVHVPAATSRDGEDPRPHADIEPDEGYGDVPGAPRSKP